MSSVAAIPYERYRTDLTFADVREILKQEQDAAREAGRYMFVTRATVLGRWHQIKREAYAAYQRDRAARRTSGRPWTWQRAREELEELDAFAPDPELPF